MIGAHPLHEAHEVVRVPGPDGHLGERGEVAEGTGLPGSGELLLHVAKIRRLEEGGRGGGGEGRRLLRA